VGQLYGLDVCSSDDERLGKVINLLENDTFIWLEEDHGKSYDVGDFGPLSYEY
jgi:ribosomal 30S subunit maturation factor RimM